MASVRRNWRLNCTGGHIPVSRDIGLTRDSSTFAVAVRRATAARRSAPSSGLVYFNLSRDPCFPDNARGVPQMRGRVCGNRTSGDAACARMCCGRGHMTRQRTFVDTRCRCRFRYCCYVTCDACQQTIEEFATNWASSSAPNASAAKSSNRSSWHSLSSSSTARGCQPVR